MTGAEWLASSEAYRMIEALWRFHDAPETLDRDLHRYYLVCCRAIWKLLPQEASRQGVEVAERFLAGEADADALESANYSAEGAAFRIDYDTDPEAIARWVEDVRDLPESELRVMLHPPGIARRVGARELLLQAAYFVDYAMMYPRLLPKGPPPKVYAPFLSAELLRGNVGNPFDPHPRDPA